MKKISITLLLISLCSHSALNAQEYSIGEVDAKWFGGIQKGAHELVYTSAFFFENAPKDSVYLGLVQVGPGLNAEYSSKTAIKQGLELAAYCIGQQEALILLNDKAKKSRIFMLLNRDGKIVTTKTENKLSEFEMLPENSPRIFSSMQAGYVLLTPIKDKTKGYEVRGLKQDLAEQWKKTFVHDKMDWEIVDVMKTMDRVLLVRKQVINANTNYAVQSIQLNDGNIEPVTELREGEDVGAYTNISEYEGIQFITGLYHNEGDGSGMKGLCFAILEPNGHFSMLNRIAFDKLKENNKNVIVNKIASGVTKVYPQAVFRDRKTNELVVVAETYRQATADELKTATEKGIGIVSDGILLLRTDMEGNYKNLKHISRPDKIAVIANSPSEINIEDIASWLNKQSFFSYAGLFGKAEDIFIGYKRRGVNANSVAFIKTDTANVVLPKPLEYNIMPVKQDTGAITYYDMSKGTNMQKDMSNIYNNILPGQNRDFVMMYQFMDSRLVFGKKQIQAN